MPGLLQDVGTRSTPAGKVAGPTPVVVIAEDINRITETNEADNELRTVVTTR